MRWIWFHKLASPPHAYRIAGAFKPWLLWPSIFMMVIAATWGLVFAPPDYQQGDAFRMIYAHVPIAMFSQLLQLFMGVSAAVGLIWNMKVGHAAAAAAAPLGTSLVVTAMATGAIWGKPMWGTWWAWDPRIVTLLISFFLYLSYMMLRVAIDDISRADRASAIVAIIGALNVPIVRYSVEWWNSLHQGQTLSLFGKSAIDPAMGHPLRLMMLGVTLFVAAIMCDRVRTQILCRERNATWLFRQNSEQ